MVHTRENGGDDPTTDAITYAQAGVDTAEGARAVGAIKETLRSTYRPEVIGDVGGFGGLFSIAAAQEMDDPILVSGTDGVGTKLKFAQLLGIHDTIGIDLVAMCANDILATGAEPLFFLDYVAVGKLKAEAMSAIVSGVAAGCREAGCSLIGGEMAEHPGVMADGDYDLSGFCVGLVDRKTMLSSDSVREGDVLLGLASSGFHSNGYSLIRKICETYGLYDTLDQKRDDLAGKSLGEAVLAPTRIYVESVLGAVNAYPGAIRSIAHITGGGITENLDRALPDHIDAHVSLGTWDVPPVVAYLCEVSGLSETEALKTFNMGVGMVLIVDPEQAEHIESLLRDKGETVYRLGETTPGQRKVVYSNIGTLL